MWAACCLAAVKRGPTWEPGWRAHLWHEASGAYPTLPSGSLAHLNSRVQVHLRILFALLGSWRASPSLPWHEGSGAPACPRAL